MPEMLNRVVAKFSPRRANGIKSSSSSSTSGSVNSNGSTSQGVQVKKATAQKAAAEQEQEDAQVSSVGMVRGSMHWAVVLWASGAPAWAVPWLYCVRGMAGG